MKPVNFQNANVVYAKDQPDYLPLPAMKLSDGTVVSCWQITDEDLERIKIDRVVYVAQSTFNDPLQPLLVISDLSELFE